jgi:hypothetical protein
MSNTFFEAIKNLFPRSRAFQLFVDNPKRRMVQALAKLPESIRVSAEKTYLDLFPDTTRFPRKWEDVFALILTNQETEKRRNVLDAMWKTISGNQGADFIQYILSFIDDGFRVGANVPPIDPRSSPGAALAICDYITMVCDNEFAVCDYAVGNIGFIPTVLQNDASSLYDIPEDIDFWRMCYFIGKDIVRSAGGDILYIQPLPLDIRWKNIIEYLVLKIKPVETTAVLFIDWQETNEEVPA